MARRLMETIWRKLKYDCLYSSYERKRLKLNLNNAKRMARRLMENIWRKLKYDCLYTSYEEKG